VNLDPVCARAHCLGVRVFAALMLLAAGLAAACGAPPTETPAGRRIWQGPGGYVASRGVTSVERREIAQTVMVPVCIEVQSDSYRFNGSTVLPAGMLAPPNLLDTGFHLGRWRLWTPSGTPVGEPSLAVTVLGSTGTVAMYGRLLRGEVCEP
jgi:hypothetical protein